MSGYFWCSWYQQTDDYRPLSYPPNQAIIGWWCSGFASTGAATICALVKADSKESAKAAIVMDWPEAATAEWRFHIPKANIDLGDRFVPDADWMKERFAAERAAMEQKS